MRRPSDLARERRARRRPGRGRALLAALGVVLFLLLTSLRGIAGFYTDYLWFDSLGFSGVFTGVLGAKVALGLLFSLIFFALLYTNLFIADRIAPRLRPGGPEEEVVERYHELIGNRTGLVRLVVAGLFALIAGAGVSSQWQDWILFTNAQTVGVDDPQFGTDIGFYLFRLPFLTFVVDWAFAGLVIILVVTAVAHYLNGGIRAQGGAQRVTPQVKAHVSVLLGILALVRAAGYWLQRFELNFSDRGVVDGATYTDVKAQLPALNLLILISLAAFALFIVNIFRRGWVLPVVAVGLWAFVAVVIGGIVPAVIQRFSVEPAESSREARYIERNIEATRAAMGLGEVVENRFAADDQLTPEDLEANRETLDNIRLWDPEQLARSYQRLQERQPYYAVRDVDVDRYEIDGETTQVMIAARELDVAEVPQASWEARHLAYTHGYGAILAPSSEKTDSGDPELLVRDVPVRDSIGLDLTRPQIYIGEGLGGYAIVSTARAEIDFQDEDGARSNAYEGDDGVRIGSLLEKFAFAFRFGDINPLISGNLRGDSRIIFQRDVRERLETLAPFLSFDGDPYLVAVDGRLQYVVDAYTTSTHYPYAQRATTDDLDNASGLDHAFNYVRNSVKAVVDAYDGTVTLYVVDEEDTLVQAYQEAFPQLFTPVAEAPAELQAHFRYPEDLFRVQTTMWGRYHLEQADGFYNRNDEWVVAPDPGTGGAASTTTPVTAAGQQPSARRVPRIEPYYQLLTLPEGTGEDAPSRDQDFVLVRPFVPFSREGDRNELTAFMAVSSDPETYGRIEIFTMPSGNLPDGPAIVSANMRSDREVSEAETLLGARTTGSEVDFGNLLVIPIEQSLIYVRPFYVTAADRGVPQLQRVIVQYDDNVVFDETLDGALADPALFGGSDRDDEPESDPGSGPEPASGDEAPEDEPTPSDIPDDIPALLAEADRLLDQAGEALEDGDLGGFQEGVEAAADLVARANELSASEAPTTTTTAPPPSA